MAEQDFPIVSTTSRFQVYPVPMVIPGKCAVCGNPNNPVVDFGMTLQFYGAVYLCFTCVEEAGAAIGLVPVSKLREAQESLAQSVDETLAANGKVAITNEQRDSLLVAVRGLSDLVLSLNDSDPAVVLSASGENESGISESISRDDVFDNPNDGRNNRETFEELARDLGVVEQIDDTVVSERSSDVPGNNSNGSSPFNL